MREIPIVLTIKETAIKFGLPEHFIRNLCTSGKIPTCRAGNKFLICESNLLEYLRTGDSPSERIDFVDKI